MPDVCESRAPRAGALTRTHTAAQHTAAVLNPAPSLAPKHHIQTPLTGYRPAVYGAGIPSALGPRGTVLHNLLAHDDQVVIETERADQDD